MAKKIPWDEHEEAILLRALINVLNHTIERKQAISDVSKQLRDLAVARGMVIDEKFRNENGISLQMNCLEYAYTGGQSGLHVTSGWYFDIVRIYKNDRGLYEKLLREANVMPTFASDNKNHFQLWLKDNKPEKAATNIISSIGVLDLLLRKDGAIHCHFFEIDNADEIKGLVDDIKRSKGLRIHSKSRRSVAVNSLYAYKEYLESKDVGETADSKKVDNSIQIASFTVRKDYSYTRPVSVEYSGKIYAVKKWAVLYVQTIKLLYEDYPDKIQSLLGKNIGGRGRVDITDGAYMDKMIAPKEFGAGLYLETNYSASGIIDKIIQLMDICGVDYSAIVIRYMSKVGAASIEVSSVDSEVKTDFLKVNGDFYTWLTAAEGLAAPTGRSYASAISNCDAFCREHNIGTGRIYGAESLEEIRRNIDLLISGDEFQDYNNAQHHRFTAALAKYQKFIGINDDIPTQRPAVKHFSAETEIGADDLMRIKTTLKLPRFEYGFKDDGVELYRFRASYAEVNGTDCFLDDDQLLTVIRKMGFKFEGKVYLISDDIIKSIKDEIGEYKNQGVNIIYYDSLYDLNSDKYFNAKIVSAEMLKATLKNLMPEFQYKNNYFALPTERQTEIELIKNDIIHVWGDSILQTFDELSVKLPLIPIDKIKSTLAQQIAFVWNSAETYTRTDLFEADELEISYLVTYIEEQCEEYGRTLLDEIPFDNLAAENPEISETALFTCFYKLIEDRFDRNARILTRKGASRDTYTAVVEFCQEQEKCTCEQLFHIAKTVAGIIRQPEIIEAANAVMVRVDRDIFISDRMIHFDVDRIDTALDSIVTDGFIGMREITTFSTFPFCGYGWNLFLLESYCRRFSKKYRYETRRANSSNSGAVVAKTCTLTYHDIMAHAVARSGRDLNQEEVFNFLTETGYMERKRYSNIDLLINEASKLRARRK